MGAVRSVGLAVSAAGGEADGEGDELHQARRQVLLRVFRFGYPVHQSGHERLQVAAKDDVRQAGKRERQLRQVGHGPHAVGHEAHGGFGGLEDGLQAGHLARRTRVDVTHRCSPKGLGGERTLFPQHAWFLQPRTRGPWGCGFVWGFALRNSANS